MMKTVLVTEKKSISLKYYSPIKSNIRDYKSEIIFILCVLTYYGHRLSKKMYAFLREILARNRVFMNR